MKRFLVAPEAVQDLKDIWQFIARDSWQSADRMMERFYSTFLKLALSPGIGHIREDLAEARPILFFSVGNYLILYVRLKRQLRSSLSSRAIGTFHLFYAGEMCSSIAPSISRFVT